MVAAFAVGLGRMRCRYMTTVSESYFIPLMGLLNGQRDLHEADNRGESSGSASGTKHGVSASASSVSSCRDIITARSRSSCFGPTMYISNNKPSNQSKVMDVDSSRSIVEDYVRYRLEMNGIPWENGQRDVTPNEIQRAMRHLGDEFENRYSQSFDEMLNQLDITPENAYQTFTSIEGEIFTDGVNWGRIVALIGFGGKLAVRCVQQSTPQLVSSIVDWVSVYVDTTLMAWIAENNGWAGFLDFCKEDPENRSTESWLSFKKICSVAAAGLGILTLGAFLTQKS